MNLALIDLLIIGGYLVATVWIGFWLSKRASQNIQTYFLAGNDIPWYFLGLSNASGMFDVSGTMIAVTWMFVYGLKSAWIPWLWPVWNQIFMMIFLGIWMRRSGVLTGAEWITFRFGRGRGGTLSHIITVLFAVIIVIAFMAYFVEGIGKFATQFLPWDLSWSLMGLSVSSENTYAILIIGLTTLYTMKGGFYSVVGTEVMQFVIMTLACLMVGIIAMSLTTPEQILAKVPAGWDGLWFGWELDLDWGELLPLANNRIDEDGYSLFGFIFMLMLFKGVWASLAGPVPSYDMQRVLSTRTPSEAAKMFGLTPLVLMVPRYFMIAGITVLALVYMDPTDLIQTSAKGVESLDFEKVLPFAVSHYVGAGFKGLLLAGLLAAFMSTFAAFINAGSAYVVNDIYKRYINDQAPARRYVVLSYLVTVAIVLIGLVFGLAGGNIQARTDWIVGLLYGSYVASNVLKWIWWRFNGYGFFYGMLAGMVGVAVLPALFQALDWQLLAIEQFPILLLVSLLGAILGSLLSPAEADETLMTFYRKTRPWGWWGPIRDKVMAEDPSFRPNGDLGRDAFNVLVGIAWQMCLVVIPIYLVLRDMAALGISLAVFAGCTWLLKRYWWDRLED
ncbi:MAG: sodium:solute symporter [Bacteroidetes bacterium]|nr:MAG: sodium:solute symporter [Bacteroidota bacterium]